MNVRYERIARVQQGMREQGLIAIVVLNHDDYRYLFGEDRWQPRALIPFQGPPEFIAFTGEEPELRAALADGRVRVFGTVGGQINDIVGRLRELVAEGTDDSHRVQTRGAMEPDHPRRHDATPKWPRPWWRRMGRSGHVPLATILSGMKVSTGLCSGPLRFGHRTGARGTPEGGPLTLWTLSP